MSLPVLSSPWGMMWGWKIPALGCRGARQTLARATRATRTEVVLMCPSRLGWHWPRCRSPGTKPQGGAFGTQHRARHHVSTRANAPPAPHSPKSKGWSGDPLPR